MFKTNYVIVRPITIAYLSDFYSAVILGQIFSSQFFRQFLDSLFDAVTLAQRCRTKQDNKQITVIEHTLGNPFLLPFHTSTINC